ncbi:MAG: tetratricopeptide repeat protein [Alphaproteobacteria bacterium]|nr:tetratricopeptide repeat protein [Alphaproteobacteria bacterium]
MEALDKALAIDDALGLAYTLVSWDHSLKGEHAEALAAGEKAVRLEPGGEMTATTRAMVQVQAGRPEEAIESFNRANRLNPQMWAINYWPRAEALRQLGRYEEMIEVSKEIIRKANFWFFEHPRLIFAYMKLGREEEARALVQEMLDGHPERVQAWLAGVSQLPQPLNEDFVGTVRQAGFPGPDEPVQQKIEEADGGED